MKKYGSSLPRTDQRLRKSRSSVKWKVGRHCLGYVSVHLVKVVLNEDVSLVWQFLGHKQIFNRTAREHYMQSLI
jgi:hypothetical protein